MRLPMIRGKVQDALVDQLEGKEKPMEEEVLEEQILALAMQALSAEEKNLIQMRFFENIEHRQTEIAGRLGMTQVQVSRREKEILPENAGVYTFLIKIFRLPS